MSQLDDEVRRYMSGGPYTPIQGGFPVPGSFLRPDPDVMRVYDRLRKDYFAHHLVTVEAVHKTISNVAIWGSAIWDTSQWGA